MNWQVYIIRCSDTTLYTGITNDIARRYRQHADCRGCDKINLLNSPMNELACAGNGG